MRIGDHPAWCAAGGAALGGLAALGMALSGALPSAPHAGAAGAGPSRAAAPAAPSAAEAFLTAWRAHLMASWSVDEVDQRTMAGGATLRFDVHEAQAPPDSVVVGNGTVAARRGATQVACGPGVAGQQYTCRSVPAPLTWAEDVDRQVAALRADVEGPAAFYAVRPAGAGCWALDLVRPSQDVPVVLGRGATFCLDLTTGALRSSQVQRIGAVDRVTVVAVHAPAQAADLALPPAAAEVSG